MTFREYYGDEFRRDLAQVLAQGNQCDNVGPTALQPRTVSLDNPAIAGMSEARRTLFSLALLLTVLTDQVIYSHFGSSYPEFSALTRYPKWKGDCPGGCYHHIHPASVLAAVGAEAGQWLDPVPDERLSALREALPDFRWEVERFVAERMPALGAEFWRRCEVEL